MENSKEYGAKENLAISGSAKNFNDWMYETIAPYVQGCILELGSGEGTMSKRIISSHYQNAITLSDNDPYYLDILKSSFGQLENVSIKNIDIGSDKDFEAFENSSDSIILINVLEHIKDDKATLDCLYRSLKPGGHAIILVPAHQWLYNSLDEVAGHFRRYTKKYMKNLVCRTDFRIERLFYFNLFAIAGWFVNGSFFKQSQLDKSAMRLFDKLVPIFKLAESWPVRGKIGISLIAILKK